MDKLEAFTTRLDKEELGALTFFCNQAKELGSQNFYWYATSEDELRTSSTSKEFNTGEISGQHSNLEALTDLGFCNFRAVREGRDYLIYHLTLFPAAMYRAEYEKLSGLGKWWGRTKLQGKELRAWVSFVLSILAFGISVYLAYLKWLEFTQK